MKETKRTIAATLIIFAACMIALLISAEKCDRYIEEIEATPTPIVNCDYIGTIK